MKSVWPPLQKVNPRLPAGGATQTSSVLRPVRIIPARPHWCTQAGGPGNIPACKEIKYEKVLWGMYCIGLLLSLASFTLVADTTWTGQISDSMCEASHAKMEASHPRRQVDRP